MSGWQAWLNSPPGRYMLQWEQRRMDEAVVDRFGYNAVQIGMPELDALRANRMPFVCYGGDAASPISAASPVITVHDRLGDPIDYNSFRPERALHSQVVLRFEELPFATASIDLLVLPHVLEFAEEPHQVLREVERVLIPEGHVIITGFNPLSLWGARQKLLGHWWPYLPREGHFISLPRLKDWLKLLSFEIDGGRFGCYGWPARSADWIERQGLMEKAGDRWWPICGAVYMLQAVKRVRGMRIIGPAWKTDRKKAAAVAAPVGRSREPEWVNREGSQS